MILKMRIKNPTKNNRQYRWIGNRGMEVKAESFIDTAEIYPACCRTPAQVNAMMCDLNAGFALVELVTDIPVNIPEVQVQSESISIEPTPVKESAVKTSIDTFVMKGTIQDFKTGERDIFGMTEARPKTVRMLGDNGLQSVSILEAATELRNAGRVEDLSINEFKQITDGSSMISAVKKSGSLDEFAQKCKTEAVEEATVSSDIVVDKGEETKRKGRSKKV